MVPCTARRYRPVTESPFDARELVGLLADDAVPRSRAVLATTIEAVQADTDYAGRRTKRATVDAAVVRGTTDAPPAGEALPGPAEATRPDRRARRAEACRVRGSSSAVASIPRRPSAVCRPSGGLIITASCRYGSTARTSSTRILDRERRSTGGRVARSTRRSTRRYGARRAAGSRRPQRSPPRERHHTQQARTPQLDVVPVGRGVARRSTTLPRQRLVGRGADRSPGLLLRSRPSRPGDPPNTQDLGFSRLAMRSMSYMSDVVPRATDPQPIITGRSTGRVRRRDVPHPRRRLRCASESAVFCSGGIQRPHVVRAGRHLPGAAPSGRRTPPSSS